MWKCHYCEDKMHGLQHDIEYVFQVYGVFTINNVDYYYPCGIAFY